MESTRTLTLMVEPVGRRIRGDASSSILDALRESGIWIRSECGGKGTCGQCRIIVKESAGLRPVTEFEGRHLTETEIERGYRLACQSIPRKSLTVFIPEESRVRERRIQVEGVERPVGLNPMIRKLHLRLIPPTLSDVRPDADRLMEALKGVDGGLGFEVDHDVLRGLPDLLRASEWDVTVTLLGDRVVSVEGGDTADLSYGVAVDIGTSKMVAHLVDLSDGRVAGVSSIENPQMLHGEDVISRITYAMESQEHRHELTALALGGVNTIVAEACKTAGVSPDNIYEMTVVGNTAMHHILLGIQPKFLALSPYVPATKRAINLKAKETGIRVNPNGNVHVLPVIAGFVGADDVGDLLSTGIHELDELSLLIDVGTNTEVNLGNRDDVLCCSCASGPAFEGAHIAHGMKAVEGAIERVRIDAETFDVEYETIGGVKPIGLCGSAMIDILAELLRCRLVNGTGRLDGGASTARLKKLDGTTAFVVVNGANSQTGRDIVITQKDIRELQLAKAAVYTGCSILMKRKNVRAEDVNRVFVAGAFGNYIDPANAMVVGLFPDIPVDRFRLVGNAAISGAKMALVSREAREEAERLSQWVRYIELGADTEFGREFTSAMFFPHKDMGRFPSVKGPQKA